MYVLFPPEAPGAALPAGVNMVGVNMVLHDAIRECFEGTPSPPTKNFPTKSPRVELSGRLPMKLYGY